MGSVRAVSAAVEVREAAVEHEGRRIDLDEEATDLGFEATVAAEAEVHDKSIEAATEDRHVGGTGPRRTGPGDRRSIEDDITANRGGGDVALRHADSMAATPL